MTATGVHNLDAMIYLFGRIDEVYCTSLRRVMTRLEDTTTVMLGFANGVSATLYCSLVTAPAYRFAVYGTKGCIELATQEAQFRFTPVTEPPRSGRHIAARAGNHRLQGLQSARRRARRLCGGDQRRAPLSDHRRGGVARGRGVRGDRALRRAASAGQGRATLAGRNADAAHRALPRGTADPG